MGELERALIKENQRLCAEVEVKDIALADLRAENAELIEMIKRLEAARGTGGVGIDGWQRG